MFQVPDWEEDIPKNNIILRKKIKNQPKNDTKPLSPQQVKKNLIPTKQETKENVIKSQATKRKQNGQIINNKKKKTNNNTLDISNIDADKADEALLNAKKKKFYEPIEKDDVEDLLFGEVTQVLKIPVSLSSNGKQLTEIIDKKSLKRKNKQNKSRKNRQVIEPAIEKPINKVFQVQDSNATAPITITTVKKPVDRKKDKLKVILQGYSTRNSVTVSGNKLRERMLDRLKAAQFRYLNEQLYTSSGTEAKELFQSDPAAFHTYHQGYQQQLKKWPVIPLDVIAKRIQKMPKTYTIADMGCGEAALSKRLPHKVRSFDLVSTTPGVETCDMAHTPLLSESMDVAVYCLALMGTELTQYLVEANRVLKTGGHLLIAEVESRFDNVDAFTKEVMKLGFKLKNLDKKNEVFFFMEFLKTQNPPAKKSKLPMLTLKPCLYKRR